MSNENDRRFELYKIAFSMLDSESKLFWQRAYVFLLIHGAFIAVLGLRSAELVSLVLFGGLGLIFSIFWLAVLRMGQEYVYRWVRLINRLEKELKVKDEKYLFEMHAEEAKVDNEITKFPRCLRRRTTTLVQFVISIIAIFWALMLIYGIYILLVD